MFEAFRLPMRFRTVHADDLCVALLAVSNESRGRFGSRLICAHAKEELEMNKSLAGNWPEERPISGAGFARVETQVSCLLTRFELQSRWSLIPFYLAFLRVRRAAQSVDGLLKAVFLIENLRTCYTLSIWENDLAVVEFGRVQAHVTVANSAFGPTFRKDVGRAEIWAAQFRLWAVSRCNLNWDGLDLRKLLTDKWVAPKDFRVAADSAGEHAK